MVGEDSGLLLDWAESEVMRMREAFFHRSGPSFQLQSPEPTSGDGAAGEVFRRCSSFRARPPTKSRTITRL